MCVFERYSKKCLCLCLCSGWLVSLFVCVMIKIFFTEQLEVL